MMGDAFSPVNLLEAGGQEAKGEQARMVRNRPSAPPPCPAQALPLNKSDPNSTAPPPPLP